MKQKLFWLLAAVVFFALIQSHYLSTGSGGNWDENWASVPVWRWPTFSSQFRRAVGCDDARFSTRCLWNDLDMSGVFDLVPKSFYPVKLPSQPQEVIYEQWQSNEVKAQDLAYGNASVDRGQFVAECRLVDVSTRESIAGLRYRVAS